MKILITGGAGFIGSHLAKKLIKEHHLTLVDNLDSYYNPEQKLNHLQEVNSMGIPYRFIQADLLEESNCIEIFNESSFDVVIHLAALPGVSYSIKNPIQYIDMDIKVTVNVLKQAGHAGIKHFIFASSSSVYGNQSGVSLSEEMANGQVVSPYAASKYGAESFCHAFQSLYGFQLSILRFFTVYGPWGRPDMAIPLFIKQLLLDQPINVFGTNTARDYTYIDDIVEGINRTILYSKGNETYNLGSGQPIKIDVLLQHLSNRFPSMKTIQQGVRQGDVNMTWSNNSKAIEKLGYHPIVNIEEGLDQTILWAKQYFRK
jgi:UDP-glucuronate 4-epimerase